MSKPLFEIPSLEEVDNYSKGSLPLIPKPVQKDQPKPADQKPPVSPQEPKKAIIFSYVRPPVAPKSVPGAAHPPQPLSTSSALSSKPNPQQVKSSPPQKVIVIGKTGPKTLTSKPIIVNGKIIGGPTQQHPPKDIATYIVLSHKQKGNPLLKYIRVAKLWIADGEYRDKISSDFHINSKVGILFLSVLFHMRNEQYIFERMRTMKSKGGYSLRILVLLADTENPESVIKELTMACFNMEFTLFVAWSNEEAARYIETFKLYEKKSADAIREPTPQETDTTARLTDCLTSIKTVNQTNASTLLKHFGVKYILIINIHSYSYSYSFYRPYMEL